MNLEPHSRVSELVPNRRLLGRERNTLPYMARENSLRVALLIVTVVFGNSALGSVALADSFDKPLRETVLDLGPSPNQLPSNGWRVKLSCYYYPAFMVKQLNDLGLKGARIATVPLLHGHVPACQRTHSDGERLIGRWGGYFKGVKGRLLFLDAADGTDEGMPFAIFDWKTGKKLFQDSVLFWNSGPVESDIEFSHIPDGKISMSYLRVVEARCSIPKDGMTCWDKFREKFGLPLAPLPKCTGYYQQGQKKWAVGDEGVPPGELETTSAIAYPVVVKLFPRPSIKAVAGPVKCSPVD